MRQKTEIVIQIAGLILGVVFPRSPAAGQNAPTVSLAEQLEAQYQLVKLGPDANGTKVLEPGAVLVIQKDGILGVPHASTAVCTSKYQDGNLDSPTALCPATVKQNSRPFKVGEKVYPSHIDVDLKQQKISFGIVACDSCNGTNPPTSFKSEVIFQFPKGYLGTASVPDVEDIIAQVFAIYTPPEKPPAPLLEQPGQAPAAPDQGLTNDDIIKLVQVKLADSLIITKIKSSACAFDTSADGLVRLKQAGVSDAVLQAMVEGGGQPITEPPPQPAPPVAAPAPPPEVSCADYQSCFEGGRAALKRSQWDSSLADLQKASSLEPSKPDPWAELGRAYVATGQYQDAVAMWDKALGLGGTLILPVWHWAGFHLDKGTLHFSANQASFVGPGGEKIFSVAPAELSSVKSHRVTGGRGCWSFGMKVEGRQYWFSFVPIGVECRTPDRCGDPGNGQEEAVANYVAQTIGKLAPGSLGR